MSCAIWTERAILFTVMKTLFLLTLFSVQAFAVQIATFRADVTPPIGAPLCGGLVKPAVGVSEPLLALGVVLLSDEKPVVLCAIDFCEIRGADHIHWREVLAKAAGTSAERVALHSLHQHNAPLVDNAAQKLLPEIGIIDAAATEKALAGVAASIEAALKTPQPSRTSRPARPKCSKWPGIVVCRSSTAKSARCVAVAAKTRCCVRCRKASSTRAQDGELLERRQEARRAALLRHASDELLRRWHREPRLRWHRP
jgi:hypothetical protein